MVLAVEILADLVLRLVCEYLLSSCYVAYASYCPPAGAHSIPSFFVVGALSGKEGRNHWRQLFSGVEDTQHTAQDGRQWALWSPSSKHASIHSSNLQCPLGQVLHGCMLLVTAVLATKCFHTREMRHLDCRRTTAVRRAKSGGAWELRALQLFGLSLWPRTVFGPVNLRALSQVGVCLHGNTAIILHGAMQASSCQSLHRNLSRYPKPYWLVAGLSSTATDSM